MFQMDTTPDPRFITNLFVIENIILIFGIVKGIFENGHFYQINPPILSTNNHIVNVKELSSVVTITAQEEITPLCPIFFDMIKQLLVVALPSITRIATNFSSRNPI